MGSSCIILLQNAARSREERVQLRVIPGVFERDRPGIVSEVKLSYPAIGRFRKTGRIIMTRASSIIPVDLSRPDFRASSGELRDLRLRHLYIETPRRHGVAYYDARHRPGARQS